MLKSHPRTLIALALPLISLIGLATKPSFANSIVYDVQQATVSPAPFGFTYNLVGQALGVSGLLIINGGVGSGTLPTCPNPCVPGALFNPSAVLTFSPFSGQVDVTGKSMKIPAGGLRLVDHVTFVGLLTGPDYSVNFNRGATLVVYFSNAGNGQLTVAGESYTLVPECETLALCGTGLALIGCVGTFKLRRPNC
jgi:hypothetical protein